MYAHTPSVSTLSTFDTQAKAWDAELLAIHIPLSLAMGQPAKWVASREHGRIHDHPLFLQGCSSYPYLVISIEAAVVFILLQASREDLHSRKHPRVKQKSTIAIVQFAEQDEQDANSLSTSLFQASVQYQQYSACSGKGQGEQPDVRLFPLVVLLNALDV
jgi:hypothetical protein